MLEAKSKKLVRRLFDEFYGGIDKPASGTAKSKPRPKEGRIADAVGVLEELGLMPPAPPKTD